MALDPRRRRLLDALSVRGDVPRSSILRAEQLNLRGLGTSLLPAGTATTAYATKSASGSAIAPRTDAVYVTAPGTTATVPGVTQAVSPVSASKSTSTSTSVTAIAREAPTEASYVAPASVQALKSPATSYPTRLESFPLGMTNLVCSEHSIECTPENVANHLFRAGDYAYAQGALRYLLTRKPAATDIGNVVAWSRAVCDAVSVALSALNLWHVPSGLGQTEVIARYYSMNPALATGFNPDLYRGYVEVPELAAFWQRHFRGTAFLSAGSEYTVPFTPNPRWTPYSSGEARVVEGLTYRIPDPRRPVTPQMVAMQPAARWDSSDYNAYVRALWQRQGGIADSQPGWFAIVGIPKRYDTDIAFSRSTFWIAQPSAQLEFATIWANFIVGKSFQDLFALCFEHGWRERYVANVVTPISLADANAVSRGIKDLTSIGNAAAAWAAAAGSAGAAFVASGPAGAVAAWAVGVLVSGINYARAMSAAHTLTVELARHPVIQPLFRRWLSAPECNAAGAPALDTAALMTKYGVVFATLLERLTTATTAPTTPARGALITDLLTAKKKSKVPFIVGGALAAVVALALLRSKR